jgi:1-acyl-sn-glycerol-3-phosphate acyltransferase
METTTAKTYMDEYKEAFEKMRPYTDTEAPAAIARLMDAPEFDAVIKYIFYETEFSQAKKALSEIRTIYDFQMKFSGFAVKSILRRNGDELTISGLDNINPGTAYLFVSNHRDIVLDSAIMQVALNDNGHNTSQITFGSNLMTVPALVDIGKLNKMFDFYRSQSKLQTYRNAMLHNAYIRKVITQQKESVWIAQRNGRTKDGIDRTEPGLITMLTAAGRAAYSQLAELNICPVSISYEIEPCAAEKATEMHYREYGGYQKQPGQDIKSVITGIMQPKGRVHLHFCRPIKSYLKTQEDSGMPLQDAAVNIAAHIDSEIIRNYKLRPYNYAAYNILNPGAKEAAGLFTDTDTAALDEMLQRETSKLGNIKELVQERLVKMYAAPLEQKKLLGM